MFYVSKLCKKGTEEVRFRILYVRLLSCHMTNMAAKTV